MTQSSGKPAGEATFVITRTFDAPRELLFSMWREPIHLERWWGPAGMELIVKQLDFTPGGSFHYEMRAENGDQMWGKFVYREIVEPEKIVYVSSFADEAGNIIRPAFSDTWPLECLGIVTFETAGGKTLLKLASSPVNATEAERRTFAGIFKSMEAGFGATFDQLDKYLAEVMN